MFDDLLHLYQNKGEARSNAETKTKGESAKPPELFADSEEKITPYKGDKAIQNEKLKLLNKCKKLSAHQKKFSKLDDAIKQASYLAVMFAEADARMFRKEIEDAEAGLENSKQGVKQNRFTYSEEVKLFRDQRKYYRKKLRSLHNSGDLRGHNVEWSAVVVMDKDGKYRAVGATSGGRKRMDGKSQPADDITGEDLYSAGFKSMFNLKAEIHTHPRFGDRHQAKRKDIGNNGLHPSDSDRKQPGVQAMVNQRGKIVKYHDGKNDKVLAKGLSKEELKKEEFGAFSAMKQSEHGKEWKKDMEEIMGALGSVDRSKIEEFQETI